MSNQTQTARSKPILASEPNIYNVPMLTANTEYSQALNNATKKILIRSRDRSATIRLAFFAGDTNVSWITIESGCVYFEDNLDLNGVTIYLQTDKNSQVAEILEWA